jgi:hypothetical protein
LKSTNLQINEEALRKVFNDSVKDKNIDFEEFKEILGMKATNKSK